MSPPLSHVGGLPVEEGLLALAPAGAALGYLLAEVRAWLRRR